MTLVGTSIIKPGYYPRLLYCELCGVRLDHGGGAMVTEKKKASNAAWDQKNMVYQTIKVRRESLERFKAACKARGERVNTVFKEFIESYPDKTE